VAFNPRQKTLVQLLKDHNVTNVVTPHTLPSVSITSHTLDPKPETLMLSLARDTKSLSHIVKLVARELEFLASRLKQVNLAVR
jgi:hypothetical protein